MTRPYTQKKLHIDQNLVLKARRLAKDIVDELTPFILSHSTVSVERTVLRLLGINGVDPEGIPLPNVVIENLRNQGLLDEGAARILAKACLHFKSDPQTLAERLVRHEISFELLPEFSEDEIHDKAFDLAIPAVEKIRIQRQRREQDLKTIGEGSEPYLYVIVATGNIYEDVQQARAAARQGADIVAVIRSTGQSLLDYVPDGPTTEGFGGTFATQENFRIMREALDEIGQEVGRYIRLTNYCSGLCMPEMAAMGAIERLDVMLNDSMYGIIFRDINMQRTFIDQYFSRMINGFAGIIINTGEDNYLTTADAMEAAHTVLTSNFINEQFAFLSGIPEEQQGLGHAMEINPEEPDMFLYEIAQAQLIREIFPRSPIKYMPPTKYMTGNIFRGHVQDTLFNIASVLTGQSIHLLGMLTEALHTPLLQDRFLSLESAKFVFHSMKHLDEEVMFSPNGKIHERAQATLENAVELLEVIQKEGLFQALEQGRFAEIARKTNAGRGLDGVFAKSANYLNPFLELLGSSATPHAPQTNIVIEPEAIPQEERTQSVSVDLKQVLPYGDTLNDGIVQLSLTLPVPYGEEAQEGARRWAMKSGFLDPKVVHTQDLGEGFTFFTLYARSPTSIDYTSIEVPKLTHEHLEKSEIENRIRQFIGRKLIIVGACIESDAHTVGIDAIMNMKGYNSHKGLESYHEIDAYNLGAQVSCEELLKQAYDVSADAILISQIVTQKNLHLRNLTRMVELLELEGLRDRFILIAGGPRINYELAKELGYDAGFGPGTYAEDVASFVLDRVQARTSNIQVNLQSNSRKE